MNICTTCQKEIHGGEDMALVLSSPASSIHTAHHLGCLFATERVRPSVLYRPALMADGNKWCALYGENLAEGVAGFGDTPAEAMHEFDKAWTSEKTPAARIADRT